MEIIKNLMAQLEYLQTIPDFNESCTVLYIVEAIQTIEKLNKDRERLDFVQLHFDNALTRENIDFFMDQVKREQKSFADSEHDVGN